jgi:hypothetical protein
MPAKQASLLGCPLRGQRFLALRAENENAKQDEADIIADLLDEVEYSRV